MLNLGALVASIGINTAGLSQATRDMKAWEQQVNTTVNSVNSKLRTTGEEMKKVGRSMSKYLTVPLTLAGGASFKLAKDFEFSMSKIVSLVGVAQSQVDVWGKDLLALAPKLGKAPKELADALYFVTSAGFRTGLALDIVTMSAKASASGLGETKVVADLVTSAMNAYSPAVLSAAGATDILVNTVREGKVESEALTGSLGWVIPVASALSVSFDQVGAAVASMTRTGTSARTASVQLRQILFSILKPSDQARDALEGMGTSASRLRKTLREDGLISTLMQLKELQKEYGEETLATVFPNIRALAGVLDIVGNNMENNIEIFKELANSTGLSSKAFEVASNTVEFKWNQALTQGKTTLLEFGKTLAEIVLPILQRAVGFLSGVTTWFTNLASANKKLVIYIGGLVAALGPLLLILGFLVGNVLPGLLLMFSRIAKVVKTFFILLETNPFVALATVIALVIVPLLNFKKTTEAATRAQLNLNKAIEEGQDLMANTTSIAQRVAILGRLNQRQVEDLKMSIAQQLAAEEDFTANLLSELQRRINADESLSSLKRQRESAETQFAKDMLTLQIGDRKEAIAKELELENKKSQTRTKQLKEYYDKVLKMIEKFEEDKKQLVAPRDTSNLEPMTSFSFNVQPEANPGWKEQAIVLYDLGKAMKALNLEYSLFGDALDIARRKQNLLKQTILDFAAAGGMGTEEMTELMAKYKVAVDAVAEAYLALESTATTSMGKLNEFFEKHVADINAISSLLTNASNLYTAQKDAEIKKAEEAAQRQGQSAEYLAAQTDAIRQKYGRKAKNMAIALATINTAVGVTNELSKEGAAGILTGLLVAAAGALEIAAIEAQPLATGGIIPSGFPNDTYPAMLSSGETVIPAAKPLPTGASGNFGGRVIFEIEGRVLKGILKQEEILDTAY